MISLVLGLISILVWPSLAQAGYCADVRNSGHAYYDTNLELCEDFETPTYTQNTGVGNGSPDYGPWYDDTGLTGDRGRNSAWNQRYGNGVTGMLFNSGEPTSPAFGPVCGFGNCTGMKVWDVTNRWGANAYAPFAFFPTQDSDFSAEVGTMTPPTNASGGGDGVFQGNASLAWRIPAGTTHGIAGQASFSGTLFEVGMTAALAYPNNSDTSGIWGTSGTRGSWKHNEWKTVHAPNCGFDGLFAFYNQGTYAARPFAGFIGSFGNCGAQYDTSVHPNVRIPGSGGIDQATCDAVVVTVGTAGCNAPVLPPPANDPASLPTALNWQADTTLYVQTRDWPDGSWGCIRGHLTGLGTTSARYRVWFTPPAGPNAGTELLLVDFTFSDTSASNLDNYAGYDALKWNAYANTNQGGGYVASTQLTFRYEDNIHIRRNGLPVPCPQIGFTGGGGGSPARRAPFNLRKAAEGNITLVHDVRDVRKEEDDAR